MNIWKGGIPGPQRSVYEGGVFKVEIVLPADYPYVASFFSDYYPLTVFWLLYLDFRRRKFCSGQEHQNISYERELAFVVKSYVVYEG